MPTSQIISFLLPRNPLWKEIELRIDVRVCVCVCVCVCIYISKVVRYYVNLKNCIYIS